MPSRASGALKTPYKKYLRKFSLTYSTDADPGYSRRRCGRGFVYLGRRGKRLTGKRTLARIKGMVIPPAWQDVWICAEASGHLQATGRDDRDRKQYLYHANWEDVRNEAKFDRLTAFAQVLPGLRATVSRDLNRKRYERRRILALTVRILDKTLIRVGNELYRKDNHSYGLTTLRDRHVDTDDRRTCFEFTGKGGKKREVTLEDQRLTKMVSQCQDLPGQQLFQYKDEKGECHPVRSENMNTYLQEITGEQVTAKLFRTWGATVDAAVFLGKHKLPDSETAQKKQEVLAVKHVADLLGNTPAVARASYISPEIFEAYRTGRLYKKMKRTRSSCPGLTAQEQSVRDLLTAMRKS